MCCSAVQDDLEGRINEASDAKGIKWWVSRCAGERVKDASRGALYATLIDCMREGRASRATYKKWAGRHRPSAGAALPSATGSS